jgi:hypothetical protein
MKIEKISDRTLIDQYPFFENITDFEDFDLSIEDDDM